MTLNELSARAMGWEWNHDPDKILDSSGNKVMWKMDWKPSTCTDDALLLLEKVCPQSLGWDASYSPNAMNRYWVQITNQRTKWAKTLPLAMTLAALECVGIPESELKE